MYTDVLDAGKPAQHLDNPVKQVDPTSVKVTGIVGDHHVLDGTGAVHTIITVVYAFGRENEGRRIVTNKNWSL